MNKDETIFIKEHGVMLIRTKLGYFEPIFYNIKEGDNVEISCEKIVISSVVVVCSAPKKIVSSGITIPSSCK